MKKLTSFAILAGLVGYFHAGATTAKAEGCGNMGCGYYYNQGAAGVPVTPVGQAPVGQPLAPLGGNFGGPGGLAPWSYGGNFQAGVGAHFAPGAFGAVRPAWQGPVGRFPKLGFRAPLRRSLGLPGFTPVRQFMFGRGAIRRQTRRSAIFGRCSRC